MKCIIYTKDTQDLNSEPLHKSTHKLLVFIKSMYMYKL